MDKRQFVREYAPWVEQGTAALFIGAGLSKQAGYPDWRTLLREIAEELGIDLDHEHDLAGVAQWHINKSGRQRTKIAQVVKNSFPDMPDVPPAHRIIARLPIRHIWTTNYDKLIERAWVLQRRLLDVKAINSDLAVGSPWADTTLFKMHGTVDHPAEIVIATDDYELYRQKRGGFLQMLNGHLIGLHFLFVGFSFTDPNISHLLGLVREAMGEYATQHYAIVRRPAKGKGPRADQVYKSQKARHDYWVDDMQRYGINCVEIDEYEELDGILLDLEAAVSRRSVFVAGSYPTDLHDDGRIRVEDVATRIGHVIGDSQLRLVSGFGLTVGSAVIAGVLSKLYAESVPSLDRSLFLRPFPQVAPPGLDKQDFQRRYREDMIRQAGICIFIGGVRHGDVGLEVAHGMIDEYEIAKTLGKVIIPVAMTGGAAEEIWKRVKADGGAKIAHVPKLLFEKLGDVHMTVDEAISVVNDAIGATAAAK